MPNLRRFKNEGWLYALAFAAAVFLRFAHLGASPLTDAEAELALQALRLTQGAKPALSAHPFYILFTSALFFLYGGGTNFLARLLPALAGSFLVLAPRLLPAEWLKPRSAVLLAFFLALDPGLVAASRLAGSPILAAAFTFAALGFFFQGKTRPAAFFVALALLGGDSIWLGLLALSITWALFQFAPRAPFFSLPQVSVSNFLFPFLTTFILFGSLFFIVPNGLSAAFAALAAFFSRWTFASTLSPWLQLLSLLIYQPLGVLLALIALGRGIWRRSSRILPLGAWFFLALIFALLLPSRQMIDLVWALIPLWTLAAIELTRYLNVFPDERGEALGAAGLTVFIWLFGWLDLTGMVWVFDPAQYAVRFWTLLVSLLILILSLLFIALGWSLRVAQFGGVWGMMLALGALGAAGAFGAAGLRGSSSVEMWQAPLLPAQADLLQATARDMSEWGAGNDYAAQIVIAGVQSPALEWLLRQRSVTVTSVLDVSSAPPLVITAQGESSPALASAYRGQDFIWRQTPAWNFANGLRWLALREMPQNSETLILWAREDLFIHQPSTFQP